MIDRYFLLLFLETGGCTNHLIEGTDIHKYDGINISRRDGKRKNGNMNKHGRSKNVQYLCKISMT